MDARFVETVDLLCVIPSINMGDEPQILPSIYEYQNGIIFHLPYTAVELKLFCN